jgi:methylglutaconyl-CoA hydratase
MADVLTIDINAQGVAMVGLNRPAVHNAFDAALMRAITDGVADLATNDAVRLAVLFGHGRSFCAGGDLNWMRSMKDYSYEENVTDSEVLADMFAALYAFPKPLVGVVHGVALGGGSGLAAMCDYVVAADNARFGFTETRLGLVPAVISPFVLEKIGVSAARATFISGAKFTAEDALRMGLAHRVVPAEELETARDNAIADFLLAAPHAAADAKALIRALQAFHSPVDARQLTTETIAKARIGAEAQEGMAAVLEGHTPCWRKTP